jgi:hypothetical protein
MAAGTVLVGKEGGARSEGLLLTMMLGKVPRVTSYTQRYTVVCCDRVRIGV